MKIRYESVTGEVSEIEVSDATGEAAVELERHTYNSDRRETRRHVSYSDQNDKWETFTDPTVDIEGDLIRKVEHEKLREVVLQLLPQQQELIHKVFFERRTIASIAAVEGVNGAAIRNRLKKIYGKMKKVLI